jgi:chain length determinant protein tyrosine kinase EpsG
MKFPFFLSGARARDETRADAIEPEFGDEAAGTLPPEVPPAGTLGAILVDAGRLRPEDAQRIAAAQSRADAPFGETAVRMGLCGTEDVQFALARQFALPHLAEGAERVEAEVVAAYHPDHELVEAMRNLRGQIARRAFDRDPPLRSIALVAADRSAGRSYITANLAVVFAQLGARTLLVDADLANARQHTLFRLGNRSGLSSILAGRADLKAVRQVDGLPGLAILPAGPLPPNPDDLVSRPMLAQLLRRLERDFDVVLLDTTAWQEGSSARMVAAAAGAAVQLVHPGRTVASAASDLAQECAQAGCALIGAVMNQGR